MKIKMAMCYNALIERLGPKIKTFSGAEKLVSAIASYLNEGAIEIRNMAKMGLWSLKNVFPSSQREFDTFLMKCIHNDKLYEKVK